MRVPVLIVDPRVSGEPVVSGVSGVAVGALHAFTLETGRLPALAVAGEWVAPVGGLAASFGSYSAKVIGTKTFTRMRLHANAGFGTWSVRAPPPASPSCPPTIPPGTVPPPGCGGGQPIVPDIPCDRIPSNGASFACLPSTETLGAPATRSARIQSDTVDGRLLGPRYMAGLGVDHAFGLSSTLVMADVVVERYLHLYREAEVVAELGLRHQLTPQIVVDVGVGRRFTGPARANSVVIGLSYDMPIAQSEPSRGER